jgi:hypothetical protein
MMSLETTTRTHQNLLGTCQYCPQMLQLVALGPQSLTNLQQALVRAALVRAALVRALSALVQALSALVSEQAPSGEVPQQRNLRLVAPLAQPLAQPLLLDEVPQQQLHYPLHSTVFAHKHQLQIA